MCPVPSKNRFSLSQLNLNDGNYSLCMPGSRLLAVLFDRCRKKAETKIRA